MLPALPFKVCFPLLNLEDGIAIASSCEKKGVTYEHWKQHEFSLAGHRAKAAKSIILVVYRTTHTVHR